MSIKLKTETGTICISGLNTRNRFSTPHYSHIVNILNNGGHMSISENGSYFGFSIYGEIDGKTELLYIVEFKSKKTLVSFNMKLRKETKVKYEIC